MKRRGERKKKKIKEGGRDCSRIGKKKMKDGRGKNWGWEFIRGKKGKKERKEKGS